MRNSYAIVQLRSTIAQLLRNSCAPNPEKQWEVPGNQLVWGTIALPFVNYCVTIAQLLRLFPRPFYSDPNTLLQVLACTLSSAESPLQHFQGTSANRKLNSALSGPISRDIAILSLRYPISRDTLSGRLALPQSGAIPPRLAT